MSQPVAIRTSRLTRTFGDRSAAPKVALSGVDLVVPRGEIHGLLGPNGAGKTTLCRILSTVLTPTSGTAEIFGADVVRAHREVRARVAVSFGGDRGLYGRLTVRENLEYWGALNGMRTKRGRARAADLIELFGLEARTAERAERLSRGMKQRLHLARALMTEPDLLILDEPTSGLDPVAQRDFHRIILDVVAPNCTILLTTHDLVEAQALCSMVTIVSEGAVLLSGTPAELSARIELSARVVVDALVPPDAVETISGVAAVDASGAQTTIGIAGVDALPTVVSALLSRGFTRFRIVEPTLTDVYLATLGDRGMRS